MGSGPAYHLWDNNGTFWCNFTLHLPDFTKARVRRSLNTKDVQQARRLRDELLASFGGAPLERINSVRARIRMRIHSLGSTITSAMGFSRILAPKRPRFWARPLTPRTTTRSATNGGFCPTVAL